MFTNWCYMIYCQIHKMSFTMKQCHKYTYTYIRHILHFFRFFLFRNIWHDSGWKAFIQLVAVKLQAKTGAVEQTNWP